MLRFIAFYCYSGCHRSVATALGLHAWLLNTHQNIDVTIHHKEAEQHSLRFCSGACEFCRVWPLRHMSELALVNDVFRRTMMDDLQILLKSNRPRKTKRNPQGPTWTHMCKRTRFTCFMTSDEVPVRYTIFGGIAGRASAKPGNPRFSDARWMLHLKFAMFDRKAGLGQAG